MREAGLRAYGGKRLKPGWSLDLTTDDPETGKPWNLVDGKIRAKATKLINEGKPFCVILSPMCTAFSTMQNINKDRRDAHVTRRELEEAKDHIRWAMNMFDTTPKQQILCIRTPQRGNTMGDARGAKGHEA